MLEVTVTGISIDPENKSPILILRARESDRILPIWIGPAEAGAITVALNRMHTPRPLTHDLMVTVLHSLNVAISAARIVSVRGGTFYAEIDLLAHGFPLTVDCRPSDAVALALRGGAPIYVKNEVLDEAGRVLDESFPVAEVQFEFEERELPESEDLDSEAEPETGEGESITRTVVLNKVETEEFMAKLLRALEPESKYKM